MHRTLFEQQEELNAQLRELWKQHFEPPLLRIVEWLNGQLTRNSDGH